VGSNPGTDISDDTPGHHLPNTNLGTPGSSQCPPRKLSYVRDSHLSKPKEWRQDGSTDTSPITRPTFCPVRSWSFIYHFVIRNSPLGLDEEVNFYSSKHSNRSRPCSLPTIPNFFEKPANIHQNPLGILHNKLAQDPSDQELQCPYI
jgi:hypothetical protein